MYQCTVQKLIIVIKICFPFIESGSYQDETYQETSNLWSGKSMKHEQVGHMNEIHKKNLWFCSYKPDEGKNGHSP